MVGLGRGEQQEIYILHIIGYREKNITITHAERFERLVLFITINYTIIQSYKILQ